MGHKRPSNTELKLDSCQRMAPVRNQNHQHGSADRTCCMTYPLRSLCLRAQNDQLGLPYAATSTRLEGLVARQQHTQDAAQAPPIVCQEVHRLHPSLYTESQGTKSCQHLRAAISSFWVQATQPHPAHVVPRKAGTGSRWTGPQQ